MAEYQVGQIYEGLKESDLYILTEFFKMLGNPTRIRILFLLMEQDANVGDLAEQLGITQSAVSHCSSGWNFRCYWLGMTQSAVSRQLNLLKPMALFWHRFLFFYCYNVTKRASRFLGKPHKI